MTEEKLGQGVKFERIRRITGYLAGSMETWNNAKKAEEKDRVKHSLTKVNTVNVKNAILRVAGSE